MSRSTSNFEDLREELHSQIADIGSELKALRKSIAKQASNTNYRDVRDGAGEIFDELWSYIGPNMPTMKSMRGHARSANRAVHDHPGATAATAIVGVAVLGLLASLLLRR